MTRRYEDLAAVKFRWGWLARLAVAILLFRLLGGAVRDLVAEGASWGVAVRLGLLAQGLWCTYSPWSVRRG